MKKKGLLITLLIVFVAMGILGGCTKKLDSPVFVDYMICSSDMDTQVAFVTNKKYEHSVTDIDIPDLPEGLQVHFYDEQIENWPKYDVHILNFGISADQLSDLGGLREEFVFHEVIVEWDDDSKTRAHIGTIHMTESGADSLLNLTESTSTVLDQNLTSVEENYVAEENLYLTDIQIPYIDELSGAIKDVSVNGYYLDNVSKTKPVRVKKGENVVLNYTIDSSTTCGYGKIFIEGQLVGTAETGKVFLQPFFINNFQESHKTMIQWVETEIENRK